jgi:hypothetical protein
MSRAQGATERRQDIGVRMALGATTGQILGLFLRHGLIVVAVEITSCVVTALAVARMRLPRSGEPRWPPMTPDSAFQAWHRRQPMCQSYLA